MGAALGNINGQKGWFKPIADEPTEKVQTRIPRSQYQQMQGLLRGQTISEFVRDAIAEKLERSKATN